MVKITNEEPLATGAIPLEIDQDSTGAVLKASYGANGTAISLRVKESLVDLGNEITGSETHRDIYGFFPALASPIAFSSRVTEAFETGQHITKMGTASV